MREKKIKVDVRGKIFTQRVMNIWNELPENVVEAGANTTFKSCLVYFHRKGIEGCSQM